MMFTNIVFAIKSNCWRKLLTETMTNAVDVCVDMWKVHKKKLYVIPPTPVIASKYYAKQQCIYLIRGLLRRLQG